MAKVKVLIEGYAKELKDGWRASSTSTLIKSGKELIVFDPGCNRGKLLDALKIEGLKPENINYVVLSHGHLDHALLTGMFNNAKVISFESLLYDRDLMLDIKDNILGDDIKIIKTPGHCSEHISLLINTKQGKYVIAGDVFWWVDGEEQIVDINKEDDSHPAELNMEKLKESRKKVLEIADYIIPGHGKMFNVQK